MVPRGLMLRCSELIERGLSGEQIEAGHGRRGRLADWEELHLGIAPPPQHEQRKVLALCRPWAVLSMWTVLMQSDRGQSIMGLMKNCALLDAIAN